MPFWFVIECSKDVFRSFFSIGHNLMSETKFLVVRKGREIPVDDLGRDLFERIGIPFRVSVSIDEKGPNSLIEVRVLAKASHQPGKKNKKYFI